MGTDCNVHYALSSSGVKPNIDFTSKDDHALISIIENKLGIRILPALTCRNFETHVSAYPLDPFYSRTLGVAMNTKKNLTPAALKFLKLTKDMMPELMPKTEAVP